MGAKKRLARSAVPSAAEGAEPPAARAPASGIVAGRHLGAQERVAREFAWMPLDRLRVWAKNPRRNAHAVGKVAASIKAFGWVRPIVVNTHPECENEIVIGHTARLAALELGLVEVPVRFVRLAPEKAHAAAIADNRLNEQSKWDFELLDQLATSAELSPELFDVAGFAADELAKIHDRMLPPSDFAEVTIDATTQYTCPKCGYEWRGQSNPKKSRDDG